MAERRFIGNNRGCWKNSEFDRLVHVATITLSEEERGNSSTGTIPTSVPVELNGPFWRPGKEIVICVGVANPPPCALGAPRFRPPGRPTRAPPSRSAENPAYNERVPTPPNTCP